MPCKHFQSGCQKSTDSEGHSKLYHRAALSDSIPGELNEIISRVTYVKMLHSYVIRNYTFGDHTDTIKHENDGVSPVGYFRSFFGF